LATVARSAVLFSWYLKNGSQDFDFSIAMDANYSFYVKNIETHAREVLPLDILAIGM
jgi:hypothetical protein